MRGVLGETAIAHLAIAELALYDPEHMLDLRSRAAEPSIAGTLPDCQPVSRRGLFFHRPKHARRLGSALPGTAGVALVAIHRRVSSRIRRSITLASCTLPLVTPAVCTRPLRAST